MEKKEEEEEDELLDFKKHSIFIDVLKNQLAYPLTAPAYLTSISTYIKNIAQHISKQ